METITLMETVTAKMRLLANEIHTQAVTENIELREILAECATAYDACDLEEIVRQIKVSDARVKLWQERMFKN